MSTWTTQLAAAGIAMLAAFASPARANEVSIGYLQIVEPAKVAQASGTYEKDSGWKINWKRFDSGADIIAAIASNAVQVAYIGSPPFAAAASRGVPIEIFLVAGQIGDAEALVARNGTGVEKPEDLIGKTVAVTFATTTHYSLLAALKHWGIASDKVKIVNMRPPEIAAAWQRGDIDAAYVWHPILGAIKPNGRVLVTSGQVAEWGAPTFDAWMVRKDFAKANPDFMKSFVKTTLDSYEAYLKAPSAWGAASDEVAKIGKVTGATPDQVLELLAGNYFPKGSEAASPRFLGGGTTKAIADTAVFLKGQGAISDVLPSYADSVTATHAQTWAAKP
jgi:taurine transport system substrate-binding protein